MANEDANLEGFAAGPSPELAAARQRLNLSQDEVALRLRLRPDFIKYMDTNQFEELPAPFVKGYIRAYAKLLGLSDDEMVELYDQRQASLMSQTVEEEVEPEPPPLSWPPSPEVMRLGVLGLAGAVVLIVLIALVWWLVSDDDADRRPVVTIPAPQPRESVAQPPTFDEPRTTELVAEPVDTSLEPVAEPAFEFVDGDSLTSEELQDGVQDVGVVEGLGVVDGIGSLGVATNDVLVEGTRRVGGGAIVQGEGIEPLGVAGELEPALTDCELAVLRGARTVNQDAGGIDELAFKFGGCCWVEVRDVTGELIYQDLHIAADEVVIQGTAPFDVLLGDPTDVELLYNGEPFDVALLDRGGIVGGAVLPQ